MIRNIWRRSAPWLILAALGLGVRTAPSQTNPDMQATERMSRGIDPSWERR